MKNAANRFRLPIIILLVFANALSSLAQNALLRGRIYDAESFENIAHVNVVIKNGEGLIITSITTGYDGRYQTDSIDPGAYRIEISSKDFEQLEMNNIFLQEGKVANFDFSLEKAAPPQEEAVADESEEKSKINLGKILGGIFKTTLAGGL